MRPAVCNVPGCAVLVDGKGRCGGDCCEGRCKNRVATRPTTTAQGYGSSWRTKRAAFVAAHRRCVGIDGEHHPNCDGVTRVADHAPITRRELVAQGDPDPDGWQHLQPLSLSCHGWKTVLHDGGWARKKSRRLKEKA